MTLEEFQASIVAAVRQYCEKNGIVLDEDLAVLKLCEEVGEFTQAVLIHRRKCRPEKHVPSETSRKMLADELADVLVVAMVNAHLFGIDLERAVRKKWLARTSDIDNLDRKRIGE